jgi:hypothetical protein
MLSRAKGNNNTGPIRNSNNRRGGARRGGGGGGAGAAENNKQKPQTAEDLDKELDMFMAPQQGTTAKATAQAKTTDVDVEMA